MAIGIWAKIIHHLRNLIHLGDNLVTKFPYSSRRQAADKPLLKINILTEICHLTNQRRSIKQTSFFQSSEFSFQLMSDVMQEVIGLLIGYNGFFFFYYYPLIAIIALDLWNITLNWNKRTWWRGRRADSGWRVGEQANAPKGQLRPQAARAQGVLGERGFPSPQPIFHYSSGP